jgi:tripartite-type tricarboxylate transporter receptor subunit TctC
MSHKQWALILWASAACLSSGSSGQGQDFPTETMRFVVNVAAGGLTDSLARLVGQGLTVKWSKPVVVENLVGGNSSLAAQAVMRAKADGHTLFVTADAPFTTTPFLVKKLNFSTSDFRPIAVICRPVPVIAVRASLGVQTLKDFIALAKSRPGTLSYSSQGVGTYGHLGMEDLKQRTGIDIVHVPYRGNAPALEGLVRGDVAALINNYSTVVPFEEAGHVSLIAAAGDRRPDARPDLATVSEQGVPGFSVSTWFGIFAPAATPPSVVIKLHEGVQAALDSDKSAEYFKTNSCERMRATPQQISELIAKDYDHWRTVIQALGIQME